MRPLLDKYNVHELLDQINVDYLVTLLLENKFFSTKILKLIDEDITNHQLVEFYDINGSQLKIQKYVEDFGESQIIDLILDGNFGHDLSCFIVDNFPLAHLDHSDCYTYINFTSKL